MQTTFDRKLNFSEFISITEKVISVKFNKTWDGHHGNLKNIGWFDLEWPTYRVQNPSVQLRVIGSQVYWTCGNFLSWTLQKLCNKFDTEFCKYFRIPQWINHKDISPPKRITLAFLKTFKFCVQILKQNE